MHPKSSNGVVYERNLTQHYSLTGKEIEAFGKGPSGELYTFNPQGEVIHFRSDDYDFEEPNKVANTFEEFVNDCLLGKRYKEFNRVENDTFYLFMKEQGWLD